MKVKHFLVAMLGIGLVVGMAVLGFMGCETDATPASTPNNGRTIVLRGVDVSRYVSVQVFMTGAKINTTPPIGTGGLIAAAISGGEVAIDVQPSGGSFLAEIPYQVTVDVDGTVRYKSSFYFESSMVDIVWTELDDPPTYGISLALSKSPLFKPGDDPLSVSIKNASKVEATGDLTVTLSGSAPDSFTLIHQNVESDVTVDSNATGSITIASIAAGDTGTFLVQPNRELREGEVMYNAVVEVSGNNISGSFFVVFTEDETIEGGGDSTGIGISLSQSEIYDFTAADDVLSVDVTNTSEEATGVLTVTVFPSDSFTLKYKTEKPGSSIEIPSIAVDGTTKAAFTVQPVNGLEENADATVVVSGDAKHDIFAAFKVRFTATVVEKIATTPDEVKTKLADDSITEVEYRGTEALTGITVTDGKTLTISNIANIANQSEAINKTGTGVITNNGTITTANTGITAAVLANLVGFAGTGKVVLTAAVTGVTAPLDLGANLEIGAGGSITFTGTGTAATAFSAPEKEEKTTVKILSANTSTALTLPASITGYGNNVNVTNAGTHTEAITTATASVTALNRILAAKGNITASGVVTVTGDGTLAIDADTTLSFTGKLTIEEGIRLKVTGDFALANNETLTNEGTIEAADATILQALINKLKDKVEVSGTDVTLAVAKIPSGVVLTVVGEQTFTVPNGWALAVEGEVVVKGSLIYPATSTGNLKGKITVEPTGIFEYLNAYDTLWGTSTTNTTGSLVVKKGATAYFETESVKWISDTASASDPVIFELEEGEFKLTKGGYALDGEVTLHTKFAIPANKEFSLSATSKLTMKTTLGSGDYSLSINEGAGIKSGEQTGAKITIHPDDVAKAIEFKGGDDANNFYDSVGRKVALDTGGGFIAEGTYEWNAAAGGKEEGKDIPGWLKAK
jgi:hypothetical protein